VKAPKHSLLFSASQKKQIRVLSIPGLYGATGKKNTPKVYFPPTLQPSIMKTKEKQPLNFIIELRNLWVNYLLVVHKLS